MREELESDDDDGLDDDDGFGAEDVDAHEDADLGPQEGQSVGNVAS